MTKFKPSIAKKNLSWEKNYLNKICDNTSCKEFGLYKAPKSRSKIDTYYFFCLNHVKEYNKSWDFYKGLSVDEIELSIRKDAVWDRPSWPLNGYPNEILEQINGFLSEDYSLFENKRDLQDFIKYSAIKDNLTHEDSKNMHILGLSPPLNLEKIKNTYKKLVKIFHPDVNKDKKNSERRFKEINQAYKILIKKFLKKSAYESSK
jgi:hypothetical protein